MERLLILLAVVALVSVVSLWWRRRDGRVLSASPARPNELRQAGALRPAPATSRWSGLPIEAADVADALSPATPLCLVEFTAPDCTACVQTLAMLHELSAERTDVSVRSLQVADSLDLVRAHRIMRAPTTLLITSEGHLLGRVSGVPRRQELADLLDSTRQPQTV
ncbi:MAG: thioredoxin family protein [Euzebya sp.]